jgi:hypothetical protein
VLGGGTRPVSWRNFPSVHFVLALSRLALACLTEAAPGELLPRFPLPVTETSVRKEQQAACLRLPQHPLHASHLLRVEDSLARASCHRNCSRPDLHFIQITQAASIVSCLNSNSTTQPTFRGGDPQIHTTTSSTSSTRPRTPGLRRPGQRPGSHRGQKP